MLCAGHNIPYHGWSTCRHCILEEDAKIESTDQTNITLIFILW